MVQKIIYFLSSEQIKDKNDVFIFISKNSSYWINFLKKKNIKVFKSKYLNEENLLRKIIKFIGDINYLTKLLNKYRPVFCMPPSIYGNRDVYFFVFLNYKQNLLLQNMLIVIFLRIKRSKKNFFGSIIAKLFLQNQKK